MRKNLRQVVTAVGDGAAASTEMERYISEIKNVNYDFLKVFYK